MALSTETRTIVAIVLMACTTYLTRILGYIALHNRCLSPRTRAVLEAVPGCVLVSVVAPYFASTDPADMAAMVITVLCALRLPFLAAVLVSIGSAALLRLIVVL